MRTKLHEKSFFFGRKDTFIILKDQVWNQFFTEYLLFNYIVAIFVTEFYNLCTYSYEVIDVKAVNPPVSELPAALFLQSFYSKYRLRKELSGRKVVKKDSFRPINLYISII